MCAAVTGAVIAAGSAAYGAHQQGEAGKDAARGANAATALQREMYERQRADQMPYMESGQRAIGTLDRLNQGDFSSFTESPDYQFTRDQGIKGLDRSAASRGTQYSGGQLAALADYAGGVASQNYSDYYNRIYQLAGLGQNAAAGVGNAGSNYANQAGANIMTGAGARAAARIGQASTYRDLGGQLSGAFGDWYERRNGFGIKPISAEQWQDANAQIPAADPYAWRRG